jgi:predicted alpha/beta hydrolase family esterase
MIEQKNTTVLIVPGLRDHVEQHWQTLLAARLGKVKTVPPLESDKLSLAARVQAIQSTIETIDGPIIVVAHSAGTLMMAHWAQCHAANIQGALLAVPPDFSRPMPSGYPTVQQLAENGWLPVPTQRLTFRSIVTTSENDPLAAFDQVVAMANNWGSELVHLGKVGHLNPASGYGDWPLADALVQRLIDGS